MVKSTDAWDKHYKVVYEAASGDYEECNRNDVDQDDDDDDDDDDAEYDDVELEYESDVEMDAEEEEDEGLVIDCQRGPFSVRLTANSSAAETAAREDLTADYFMDSDSGIQDDFLACCDGSGNSPRRRSKAIPTEYYGDSE